MNLLTDNWIPVRPQESGLPRQISLQTLLCENQAWELTLPRDDMELAALQLLICLVQVIFPPEDKKQWLDRLKNTVSEEEYTQSIQQYLEWLQLDHPEYPFMQVKGVEANIVTPMDKLLTGLDTSTNSRFVNEDGLGDGLCPGCTSIALYNQANNAPSFGGGFKYGIRGGKCFVSTFIQGNDLRSTLWLNVLTKQSMKLFFGESISNGEQKPTWIVPIEEKSTIQAHQIGFARGLLWQPGHIELVASNSKGQCSCCGHASEELYTGFSKAKFKYTIGGFWHHPHSPHTLTVKDGEKQQKFVSFTLHLPAWTQLSRYVVKRDLDEGNEGQEPALIIRQAKKYAGGSIKHLELLVGGYRNDSAKILERRHEMLLLNQGWDSHPNEIHDLVKHGMAYKTALRKALWIVAEGIRKTDIKGTGVKVHEVGETQFFRRTENTMLEALANIDFSNERPTFVDLDKKLTSICRDVFEALTKPYQHDPVLLRTIAIARRSLGKQLKENKKYSTSEEEAA